MNVNTLTPEHNHYPPNLQYLHKVPKQLFLAGNLPANDIPRVAIVGPRKASRYALEVAELFASQLSTLGVWVVSGLALGVDTAAHRGALPPGNTVAVLPGGVEDIYPRSNRNLSQTILDGGGGILSEHAKGSEIRKHSFIERNRIIAGISDAVVVVEAAKRSGSLTTAQFALEQGRPVLAVPGNITNLLCQGSNKLLALGARPALSVDDILEEIGFSKVQTDKPSRYFKTKEMTHIYELISSGENTMDKLIVSSQLKPNMLNSTITALELDGIISRESTGGWIIRPY